ncbi:MAG: ABC transporter substrate-binding protein, partial [Candidatus Kariarchaeaceae archaeon]
TEIISDLGTLFMAINMDHPIIGTGIDSSLGKEDPSKAEDAARYIRQAISHAVPREYIINNIHCSLCRNEFAIRGATLWPELAVGYDTSLKPYEYNLTRAKELMEMAGYEIKTSSDSLPLVDLIPIALSSLVLSVYIVKRKHKN